MIRTGAWRVAVSGVRNVAVPDGVLRREACCDEGRVPGRGTWGVVALLRFRIRNEYATTSDLVMFIR